VIASTARRIARGQDERTDRDDLAGQPRGHGHWPRSFGPVTLLAVLVVQAILSLRLTWSNTAFQDEALYLWAGHLEWASWLHGVPIAPAFPSYFSGAPVIYPPIGAVGDSLDGLTGARLISLCFMLGATALLWSATRRLFDERAAFFAAAVFAGTAATQFLGAFATYDAMALTVLAAAAWCAIRGGECRRNPRVLLVTAAVALLVLANVTKYASVLWDPVVLVLAGLAAARHHGRKAGLVTGVGATVLTACALTSAVLLASRAYWDGFRFSTLERSAGGMSSLTVLLQAGGWIGLVAVLAIAGAVIGTWAGRGRVLAWTGCVLAVAVLLAPAEQARIHTTVSLFKHVGYGGWFGAIMAGYAIAELTRPTPGAPRRVLAAASAVLLIGMAAVGSIQADRHDLSWPNSAALIASLRPLADAEPGPSLAEDPFVPSYYLGMPGGSWSSTWYFVYRDPVSGASLTGIPAYADAIRHDYFKLVVIGFTSTYAADRAIESDLRRNSSYHLAAVVPWSAGGASGHYLIWHYQPVAGVSSVLPRSAGHRCATSGKRMTAVASWRTLGAVIASGALLGEEAWLTSPYLRYLLPGCQMTPGCSMCGSTRSGRPVMFPAPCTSPWGSSACAAVRFRRTRRST